MFIYTLPHLLENSAAKYPEHIAFKYMGDQISYKELNEKADKLAYQLQLLNVVKGDRVGIYMPRCLDSIIAVYGILKAGAAYVPLDPFSPISRSSLVINDCNIEILLTTSRQAKKIKKIAAEGVSFKSVIGVNDELLPKSISWEAVFKLCTDKFKKVNILDQDIAYILYTSGSTGTPKGIVHTHRSGLQFVQLTSSLYGINNTDVIGMHAPLHFDPSTLGLFSAVHAGATTVIVSDAETKMPNSLAKLIADKKITIWFSVPLALVQLLRNGLISKENNDSLRWVLFSGEVFITKYLKEVMQIWSQAKFSNIYGPTELNQCTYYNLETPPKNNDPIPIGYVWGNSEFKILDANDNEVAYGEKGELVVRSSTMMQGYWNNKKQTEKSFFIKEVVPGVTQVFYRTGDQVKLNSKGELLYLGRNDRQVKIRGYRVEIDEVENTLNTHSDIVEAAVIVVANNNEKSLVAYVVVKKHSNVSSSELLKFSKSHVPIYAVPDSITILEDFPRTSSGKINRKQLQTH